MNASRPHDSLHRTQVSVDEARELILASLPERKAELRKLREASGLVLAQPLFAREPAPHFDTVAMDGFAIRAASVASAQPSTPVSLPIVDTVLAGDVRELALPEHAAIRIMTGARLPNGADAVIPLERTSSWNGVATFSEAVRAGANIRQTGEDIQS